MLIGFFVRTIEHAQFHSRRIKSEEYDRQTYLPENVQKMIITVAREPRFEGERKPASAKTEGRFDCTWSGLNLKTEIGRQANIPRVIPVITTSCDPLPTRTESAIGQRGALKTSP